MSLLLQTRQWLTLVCPCHKKLELLSLKILMSRANIIWNLETIQLYNNNNNKREEKRNELWPRENSFFQKRKGGIDFQKGKCEHFVYTSEHGQYFATKHIFKHIKIKFSFPHNLIQYYSFAPSYFWHNCAGCQKSHSSLNA